MLLDAFVREDFQRVLATSLPATTCWDRQSLHLLICTLLEHFEKKYQHQKHIPVAIAPLIEQAIHGELTTQLLCWLQQGAGHQANRQIPLETIARITGWAIFGPIIQWSQEESIISVEQMSNAILLIVLDGVERLVPDALI
ncbi:hypothetical protein KDW_63360 [Dictyobacter vulcani]|uniref:Tetracyclin repressor-like C-terminal domain-containing protein n=2 Tax=Dictyobacter vulcani TaxID=2607529 RepID=A0A5J4KS04_9CHLR|nr:hypothetical protein KDW_63360 [Dictyobacter vulcani]